MQSLAVPTEHNPNSRTPEEILSALRGTQGFRRFSFRYELTDAVARPVMDLPGVSYCSVEQNWLADIKRTMTIRLRDNGQIDYLADMIRPWVRLHLPPYQDRDWVEWPQGTFLLSASDRNASAAQVVSREIQGYDRLLVLAEDKVDDRYAVAAGTAYTTAIGNLIAPLPVVVTPSALTLPTTREWDPGTSKLKIVNDLLDAINYQSLSFDELGNAIVAPYRTPAQRPEEYVYADDELSVIHPEVAQELDLFSVPNKWVLVVSDPDRAALRSVYTNNDPGSPTSTVRRKRTITDFRTDMDAASQATLDARAARLAFEASQVYESVTFSTGIMPIHSGNDVYRLRFGPLSIGTKYTEQSWRMELRAGARMEHRARRVVSV